MRLPPAANTARQGVDKIRAKKKFNDMKLNRVRRSHLVVAEDRELRGVNLLPTRIMMNSFLPTTSLPRISLRNRLFPVPSSLRRLKRAVRSLFPYGEETVRLKCARTAKNAKKSGSPCVLPALS